MSNLKVYNGFCIVPTTTYTAAGLDFYIPNIKVSTPEEFNMVVDAFKASYKRPVPEVIDAVSLNLNALYPEFVSDSMVLNVSLLYLSIENDDKFNDSLSEFSKVGFFFDDLCFDKDGNPGVVVRPGDYLFVNSGLKLGLEPGTAGIFFNKSGKGTKGWDVRACVVDEDYAGYVHLSMTYDKRNAGNTVVYCGDKMTQMVVLPVIHPTIEVVSEDEHSSYHANSKRGTAGFGSSDVKH